MSTTTTSLQPREAESSVADGLLAAPTDNTAARSLVVPEGERGGGGAWLNDAFRLITTQPRTGDPLLRIWGYAALPDTKIGHMPADHPVFTASIGDTWTFEDSGLGESPVYEFVGRFHVADKFIEPGTVSITYVLEELR